MGNRKHISEEEKSIMIRLNKSGHSSYVIAQTLGRSASSILSALIRVKKRKSIKVGSRSGRPRITSRREDRQILKEYQRNRQASSTTLMKAYKLNVSQDTITRRLKEVGLKSYRLQKKPKLSDKNIRDRLAFCTKYRDWSAADWKKSSSRMNQILKRYLAQGLEMYRENEKTNTDFAVSMPSTPLLSLFLVFLGQLVNHSYSRSNSFFESSPSDCFFRKMKAFAQTRI